MSKALVFWFVIAALGVQAQEPIVGKWRTIDDDSGEEKSIVEIVERNGKFFGKIIRIYPKPGQDPDPVCNKCPEDDPRFKKKILGLELIKDLVKSGEEYTDGTILDPEPGKVYKCKVWMEGNDLKVRGFWGPFYRTQTWKRVR